MPSLSYFRFLREADGDLARALEHACRSYDYVCGYVSVGLMRAGPATDHTPKARIVPLDVDRTDPPHG